MSIPHSHKAPALLEPQPQIVWCYVEDSRLGSLTSEQSCSRCILQPQPTGRGKNNEKKPGKSEVSARYDVDDKSEAPKLVDTVLFARPAYLTLSNT